MAEPLLAVESVSAYYGRAQALEDVSFEIAGGATSVIGRNGMGKTTLCNAIVGLPPARVTGSIRFQGKQLVGIPSYKVAQLGIGYVPQGRRLFPSLSVDEHLRMISSVGFVSSARAMASICCSPPESCAPPFRLRSRSRGKSSYARSIVQRFELPRDETMRRCSSTESDGNRRRPCGT